MDDAKNRVVENLPILNKAKVSGDIIDNLIGDENVMQNSKNNKIKLKQRSQSSNNLDKSRHINNHKLGSFRSSDTEIFTELFIDNGSHRINQDNMLPNENMINEGIAGNVYNEKYNENNQDSSNSSKKLNIPKATVPLLTSPDKNRKKRKCLKSRCSSTGELDLQTMTSSPHYANQNRKKCMMYEKNNSIIDFNTFDVIILSPLLHGCTKLDLSSLADTYEYLGDTYTTRLMNVMNENNNNILHLQLSNNSITNIGANSVAKALRNDNNSILSLNLSSNMIGDSGVKDISQALIDTDGAVLETLSLADNHFSNIGIKYLSKCLLSNRSLVDLNLSSNDINYSQFNYFEEGLSLSKYLKKLNLSLNKLGDGGAILLGHCLSKNHSLTHLDVQGNLISSTGSIAIANGLLTNKSLITLNLRNNECDDKSADSFGKILKFNKTLRKLNLEYNFISMYGKITIDEAVAQSYSFCHVILSNNFLYNCETSCSSQVNLHDKDNSFPRVNEEKSS